MSMFRSGECWESGRLSESQRCRNHRLRLTVAGLVAGMFIGFRQQTERGFGIWAFEPPPLNPSPTPDALLGYPGTSDPVFHVTGD
jgi:hypothetical protein